MSGGLGAIGGQTFYRFLQVISGAWFPSDLNKELRFIRLENQLFGCICVNSNHGFMYFNGGEA